MLGPCHLTDLCQFKVMRVSYPLSQSSLLFFRERFHGVAIHVPSSHPALSLSWICPYLPTSLHSLPTHPHTTPDKTLKLGGCSYLSTGFSASQWFDEWTTLISYSEYLRRKKKILLWRLFHASVFLRKIKYNSRVLVGRIPVLDTLDNSFGAGDPNCFDNSRDWICLLKTIMWPRRLMDFPGLSTLTRHLVQPDVFLPLE